MNICAKILASLAVVSVFGCVREEEPAIVPDGLNCVPSDALAVVSGMCKECLSELDSAHVFRNIGLEEYLGADAVLAFCHTSSMSPVLVLDAEMGPSVVARAEAAGVLSLLLEVPSGEENAVTHRAIFTISESTMAAVSRHLSMGTSVMDAPGFVGAVEKVADCRHWAIIRNVEIGKLLPKDFLGGIFSRRDILRLFRNFCDWTCLKWNGTGEFDVIPYCLDSHPSLSGMMASVRPGVSKLPLVLPLDTELAIDMPVEPKPFRKAYASYLDAIQRLPAYENTLELLKKKTGVNPVHWENGLGIREIAMVRWNGRKVVLLRPSSKKESEEPGANPYLRFTSALYGFPFDLEDDSFRAGKDGWIVVGSENDVMAFLDEDCQETFDWPARPVKLAIYTPDAMVAWTKDNLRIEL